MRICDLIDILSKYRSDASVVVQVKDIDGYSKPIIGIRELYVEEGSGDVFDEGSEKEKQIVVILQ